MKISTKGRYALRLMLDLAIHDTGVYVSLRDIATRQDISTKYLEQIITQLNRAGFVKSIRGAQGGYMLANAPETYTVGMILRVMEGSLAPVTCLECSGSTECPRADTCVTMEIWVKIQEAVDNVVDNITLADLVERYNEKVPMNFSI
ncbi:MAG: Rrf2 family transcriptional regulator [Oscillospiraceae bacterium]|nr:Rrf2 family transcriptional regulator [Oscillospiraceae bacterium]